MTPPDVGSKKAYFTRPSQPDTGAGRLVLNRSTWALEIISTANGGNRVLWSSPSDKQPGDGSPKSLVFVLDDNGNAILRSGAASVWSTDQWPHCTRGIACTSRLCGSEDRGQHELRLGEGLVSSSGKYVAWLRADGEFIGIDVQSRSRWLILQGDHDKDEVGELAMRSGRFVLLSKHDKDHVLWQSGDVPVSNWSAVAASFNPNSKLTSGCSRTAGSGTELRVGHAG
jgi:hypothetical protein